MRRSRVDLDAAESDGELREERGSSRAVRLERPVLETERLFRSELRRKAPAAHVEPWHRRAILRFLPAHRHPALVDRPTAYHSIPCRSCSSVTPAERIWVSH